MLMNIQTEFRIEDKVGGCWRSLEQLPLNATYEEAEVRYEYLRNTNPRVEMRLLVVEHSVARLGKGRVFE